MSWNKVRRRQLLMPDVLSPGAPLGLSGKPKARVGGARTGSQSRAAESPDRESRQVAQIRGAFFSLWGIFSPSHSRRRTKPAVLPAGMGKGESTKVGGMASSGLGPGEGPSEGPGEGKGRCASRGGAIWDLNGDP